MSNDEKTLNAGCHCGAIKLLMYFDLKEAKIEKCNCSMCSRKFAAYVFVDVEEVKIIDRSKSIQCYSFHTCQAKHFFCSICGIHTHHLMRVDPTKYAVNLACLENIKIEDYQHIVYWNGREHPNDS